MLEYQKKVLQKLSFDSYLFIKELNKSIKWLTKKEYILLQKWVRTNYKSIEFQHDTISA
jgi:hypothetical protein